jgi:hypothetical protein
VRNGKDKKSPAACAGPVFKTYGLTSILTGMSFFREDGSNCCMASTISAVLKKSVA